MNSIYSHKEILYSSENAQTTTIHSNIDESHKNMLAGRSQTQNSTYCMIPFIYYTINTRTHTQMQN